jgi:hypothetical protein
LWSEYSEKIHDYLYMKKEFPKELFKRLTGMDCEEDAEECFLLSDEYYDHECAHQIAIELERILDILRSLYHPVSPTERKDDNAL